MNCRILQSDLKAVIKNSRIYLKDLDFSLELFPIRVIQWQFISICSSSMNVKVGILKWFCVFLIFSKLIYFEIKPNPCNFLWYQPYQTSQSNFQLRLDVHITYILFGHSNYDFFSPGIVQFVEKCS